MLNAHAATYSGSCPDDHDDLALDFKLVGTDVDRVILGVRRLETDTLALRIVILERGLLTGRESRRRSYHGAWPWFWCLMTTQSPSLTSASIIESPLTLSVYTSLASGTRSVVKARVSPAYGFSC